MSVSTTDTENDHFSVPPFYPNALTRIQLPFTYVKRLVMEPKKLTTGATSVIRPDAHREVIWDELILLDHRVSLRKARSFVWSEVR